MVNGNCCRSDREKRCERISLLERERAREKERVIHPYRPAAVRPLSVEVSVLHKVVCGGMNLRSATVVSLTRIRSANWISTESGLEACVCVCVFFSIFI